MRFRWTIEELETNSDLEIVKGILTERLSDLNPYTPLAKRLMAIRSKIEKGEELTAPDK